MGASSVCFGIFVGGRSTRMGGLPKGLLAHPTEAMTLVERACSLVGRLGASVVLVGDNPAYATLGIEALPDRISGIGPLGGLDALVHGRTEVHVGAIACDLPFVPLELLERLVTKSCTEKAVIVPVRDGGLEPLCALYRRDAVLPLLQPAIASGRHSLCRFVESLDQERIHLCGDEARWLDDWDSPEDVARA